MSDTPDFGHYGIGAPGIGFIDHWGSGPLLLRFGGREWWFEFSEMFGPLLLRKSDLQPMDRQPTAPDDPFWLPFDLWNRGGRKTRAIRTKRRNRVKFHLCHVSRRAIPAALAAELET